MITDILRDTQTLSRVASRCEKRGGSTLPVNLHLSSRRSPLLAPVTDVDDNDDDDEDGDSDNSIDDEDIFQRGKQNISDGDDILMQQK